MNTAALPLTQRHPKLWLLAAAALWWALYQTLIPASVALVALLPVARDSHLGSALQFFFYDTPKVLLLLTGVVFVMGMVNSYFTPQRTRALLAGRREGLANGMAATLGGVTLRLVHRGGGHTPGDMMVYVPAQGVVFTGDVVYVDRILGMHPVSRSKPWLATFEALQALQPRIVVPGHGRVTDLAQAQRDTGELLRALRAHTARAVDEGVDLGTAVRTFDARPFAHLKHTEVWLPQLVNRTYLEVEQE
ncbi:MBL fold metallo-hydrolase [Tepidimonas aquatica]|uniref:Quinoprotein relay system zinc metallohydrolase 1 n=1 Tax=Tepidimonas aquatica TaxID=247482 RepID=A0A554WAW6_9BURK|nr:MBL fold metallo-hydrolase [Tepidimonas aquatica]TSE20723.1 quinoprotein relay system zinc metallohydrolase 1 [Tepidimonas aquatica]